MQTQSNTSGLGKYIGFIQSGYDSQRAHHLMTDPPKLGICNVLVLTAQPPCKNDTVDGGAAVLLNHIPDQRINLHLRKLSLILPAFLQ